MRSATAVLGLLLAVNGAACNSPTRPSQEDRFEVYTGRWRGNINGVDIVLEVRAERGFGSPYLGGTGTAVNAATGETYRLTISGFGTIVDAESTAFFNIFTADEFSAGGLLLSSGKHTGDMRGNVSRDGRTWPGRWTSTTNTDGAPIFGPGEHPFTLIKE